MSYILHIDTSGNEGTVAIANNGVVLATEITADTRNQAAAINNMIATVLTTAGIAPAQLNAVAVCGGPGSYTGLRIGMATAKGLCYALDIPLLAYNKLTLIAASRQHIYTNGHAQYTTLLVAREKEYFITVLDADSNSIMLPQHVLESDLIQLPSNSYLVTDADATQLEKFITKDTHIDANVSIDLSYWAIVAKSDLIREKFVNIATVAPFYLKEVYTHK